jgi:hypothetical protein
MSYCKPTKERDLDKIENGFIILWIITVFTVAPASFFTGSHIMYKSMTNEAIENHVGEWVVDNKTGVVNFKYKHDYIYVEQKEKNDNN